MLVLSLQLWQCLSDGGCACWGGRAVQCWCEYVRTLAVRQLAKLSRELPRRLVNLRGGEVWQAGREPIEELVVSLP